MIPLGPITMTAPMSKKRPAGRALRAASTLALLASAAIGSSCSVVSSEKIDDHWTFDSVPPRVARSILGFDGSRESGYRDFAWDRKASINLTVRRYFFNHNPLNPNQRPLDSLYEPRPLNSLLPNPLTFIHVEGFLLGWAITGIPIPIPVDSIIGVFTPGGPEEFADGFTQGFGPRESTASKLYGEDGDAPEFEMSDRAR